MSLRSMNIFANILIGVLLQVVVGQSSSINDSHFIAGVVEFRPDFIGLTTEQLIEKHTNAYIEILQSTEALETDIVVFPEATLNNEFQPTFVPAPEEAMIPCLLVANQTNVYDTFLIQLSCAARLTRKYVIINLTERENCTTNAGRDPRPCAANGLNIFNTNVVFDREGRVISRYRKVNIYTERKNTTYLPEFAIFDTDFGVRFAHFICFDLLFYTPAEELVTKYGIRNIIFTSMFYSELPFLTAVQLQQSWSWGNNVTLLAAGASYPQSGATGSGIYAGDNGVLTAAMIGHKGGVRQLYVTKVPKYGNQNELPTPIKRQFANVSSTPQTAIRVLRDPQLDNFKSQLFQLNSSTQQIKMQQCFDELCCHLSAETMATQNTYGNSNTSSSSSSTTVFAAYQYRFGVFKGRRSYEKEQYSDVAICAIYACTNVSTASCGRLLLTNTVISPEFSFKNLKITGSFRKAQRLLLMPNTLDLNFYSLQPEEVQWVVADEGKSYTASIDLKSPADNLLAFGIYANYYDSSGGSSKYAGSVLMLLLSLLLWKSIYFVGFK